MSEKEYAVNIPDSEGNPVSIGDCISVDYGSDSIPATPQEIYHALLDKRREVVVGKVRIKQTNELYSVHWGDDKFPLRCNTFSSEQERKAFIDENKITDCDLFYHEPECSKQCSLHNKKHYCDCIRGLEAPREDEHECVSMKPSDKCPGAGSYDVILRKKGE